MASKVVDHFRAEPETITVLGSLDFIRDEWLADLLDGRVEPRPSSVAFLTNLVSASATRHR